MKFLVLMASVLISHFSLAQSTLTLRLHQIPVNGVIRQQPMEVVLGRYQNDNFALVSALAIGMDTVQQFVFTIPKNTNPGLYQLFIGDKRDQSINKAEFIWNPSENLVADAVFFQLKDGSISLEKSLENEAYAAVYRLKGQFDPVLDELYQKRFALVVFDAQYKQKSLQLEYDMERAQLAFNNALTQIAERYPDTYTTQVLIPLSLIPVRSVREAWANQFDSYLSFLHRYYFYHVDFNNSGLLTHYAFQDKLFEYLNKYIEHSTTGSEQGIDVIMNNLQENDAVNSFVYNLLLKSFIKAGSEHLTQYVVQKHSSDCALDLPFEDLKKLQSIQALSIGGTAPEISLPDLQGNYQSLRAYCQKNKYTVVFLWLSWCARCQKETPAIFNLYKQYQTKGLGVYSVCLDEKREDWSAAVQKYGTTWINVAELVPIAQSQIIANYNISTTPAIFVLNSKGEVVQKAIFGEALAAFLSEKLK